MNIEALLEARRLISDTTQSHFLYFALGFSASTILWLTMVLGFIFGRWRRGNKKETGAPTIS